LEQVGLVLLLALLASSGNFLAPVSVVTDAREYMPGDIVTIYVTLPVCPCANTSLWIYVDTPNLTNLVFTPVWNPNRTEVLLFQLPKDAPYGNYTITATLEHNYGQTWFMVVSWIYPIPEFPSLSIPEFVIVLVISLLVLRKRGLCL
jgi:hypothetical protein